MKENLDKVLEKNPNENVEVSTDSHGHDHHHGHNSLLGHWDLLLALVILVALLVLKYGIGAILPQALALSINLVAYFLAGRAVLATAWKKSRHGDIFNEFVLMSVATIGAFLIGEYEEGVAVMVFYRIGEWFQHSAVDKAKGNIQALLDLRPETVTVVRNGETIEVAPKDVAIGETILVKPGERVGLDGVLVSETGTFNTAALTGESVPESRRQGEKILAGMVNINTLISVKVAALFRDSKLSQILGMVQEATARKSQTQLFIARFAKVYTPIVFFLAVAVCVVPFFFLSDYVFQDWFYRALVFLVISCPCALVISIPLGYFGGIGLASKNGILFKGGNYLDVMAKVSTVVMDKTGTLTKGVFEVQEVVAQHVKKDVLVAMAAGVEQYSTHPIAQAVVAYAGDTHQRLEVTNIEEIAGLGLKGMVEGKEVLVGNLKLLKRMDIAYPQEIAHIVDTLVLVCIDRQYAGHMIVADEIKEDARSAVDALHKMGVDTVMLSGDRREVVEKVAQQLGIEKAYGDLMPEDKLAKVQAMKNKGIQLAFAGDGINDAPVIALSDAGIAMGGLGSDAAIETADIVIQNDQPSKIPAAIKAGKITRNIVWQNIVLAMTVKTAVLILGAGGVATLWEAVIADVGVALLAILNAVRIQGKKL